MSRICVLCLSNMESPVVIILIPVAPSHTQSNIDSAMKIAFLCVVHPQCQMRCDQHYTVTAFSGQNPIESKDSESTYRVSLSNISWLPCQCHWHQYRSHFAKNFQYCHFHLKPATATTSSTVKYHIARFQSWASYSQGTKQIGRLLVRTFH